MVAWIFSLKDIDFIDTFYEFTLSSNLHKNHIKHQFRCYQVQIKKIFGNKNFVFKY